MQKIRAIGSPTAPQDWRKRRYLWLYSRSSGYSVQRRILRDLRQ